mgnify:CR=1 FL=1
MIYQFNYLLAGGGCAGLAMAAQLHLRFGAQAKILIVDRDDKNSNDRTWAFWSDQELPLGLDKIVRKEWSAVRFRSPSWERTTTIAPYQYRLINGIDYYRFMRAKLEAAPNVYFLKGEISHLGEDDKSPWARVNNQLYRAEWIFDSRVGPETRPAESSPHYFLWQHFYGWRVKMDKPHFATQVATLMDFSHSHDGHPTFFYCLPFSPTEALVEFTAFSNSLMDQEAYRKRMVEYLHQRFGPAKYIVTEEEQGRIPMTDVDLANRNYRRIRSIGTAGNAVKPTTGYAFLRIQQQAESMAKQLFETGQVDQPPKLGGRFRWYDHLLLYLLQFEPQRSERIFSSLFEQQPFDRILRFLDEDTAWWEEVMIFKDLPIGWFLEAAWKHQVRTSPIWSVGPTLTKGTQYG